MKLQELGAKRPSEQIAKTLRTHLGDKINFDRLDEAQSAKMLSKVRGLLREYKTSVSRHFSERNPDYLRLIMLEQALCSRIGETKSKVPKSMSEADEEQEVAQALNPTGVAKAARATGTTQVGQLGKALGAASAGKALDPTQRKAMTGLAKGIGAMMSDPSQSSRLQQMLQKSVAENQGKKSRARLIKEASDVQQAQVVMAAQDMVDQLQKVLEQVSAMQFKDLPALTDAIKNEIGVEQATQFQTDATAALTQVLTAVQAGKTQMETAQGVLTGQAPIVPGDMETSAMPMGEPGEVDADLDIDATLPAPEDEEDGGAPVASLGRERR